MSETPGGRRPGKPLKVAIYDMPAVVGKRLCAAMREAGHSVLAEGILDAGSARSDADIWLTKWSFGLSRDFLSHARPRIGFISATSGVDHIDRGAMAEFGLRAENCPSFSSRSVAEHALALSFRGLFPTALLPPLCEGPVTFTGFRSRYAVQAVAHMLMRNRQIDSSITRAKGYQYLDGQKRRPSEPWSNRELTGSTIGIVGRSHSMIYLANILKSGFDCRLLGHDTAPSLAAYNVSECGIGELAGSCDYIFVCDGKHLQGNRFPRPVDSGTLDMPRQFLDWPRVAVLGTGAIGSYIAKICCQGFRCTVRAFNRSMRPELKDMGVEFPDRDLDPPAAIARTIKGANFIFVALPLTDETRKFNIAGCICEAPAGDWRVLVNVTRDRILESGTLFSMLEGGRLLSYATDVVPNDFSLCSGNGPDVLARRFVESGYVVPTPHEAECSHEALERLVREVLLKAERFT